MSQHSRKIKQIELSIGGSSVECQVQTWTLQNNTEDGEKLFSQCPDGEFREEGEDDYALEVTFYSDWRSGGISDWLTEHDKELVVFQLDHHPDIPAEHVRWTGELYAKAPPAGGEARTTEMTEVTLQIKGKPEYSRP